MSDFDSKLIASDELWATMKVQENFDLLINMSKDHESVPEYQWRLARAYYEIAAETTKKDESRQLTEKGLELVLKAKEKLPENSLVVLWQGILLGKLGDFLSTKEKISNAFVIRDCFLKAIELNPKDQVALFCMAKWCFSVVQISWVERQAASLLFGAPPTSTLEECEKYLLASWALYQGGAHTALLLGDVYYQQKKLPDAKKWYTIASECPAPTENKKREVAEAKKKAGKC